MNIHCIPLGHVIRKYNVSYHMYDDDTKLYMDFDDSEENAAIWSKKTQAARGWTAADICTNCVYTIPAPRDGGPIPFFGASRPSLPAAWLALFLTKAGDVESNPGPTTHTNTPLLQTNK